MATVYFIGTANGRRFNAQADKLTVQNLLSAVINGKDEILDEAVKDMGIAGKCIDAMAWEEEGFMEYMIVAMDIAGRFAIQNSNIKFGVATDEVNAMAAFRSEEF